MPCFECIHDVSQSSNFNSLDHWVLMIGNPMKLLHDLLLTDYGLMSFIGIVFMIGMAIFFVLLFFNKIALGKERA